MHLGVASPVDIPALRPYLTDGPAPSAAWPVGMGGSAVTPLLEGLLAAGHRVAVYTLDPKVAAPLTLRGPQLTVYVGPFRPRARQHCPDLFAQEAAHIAAFIRHDQPELVHAHWGYEFAWGALRSGFPHLITLHDNPWQMLRYQTDAYRVVRLLLKQRVLRRGRHFTAVSPYLAATLAGKGRQPAVVPNAVRPAAGAPRTLPATGPVRLVSMLTQWSGCKNASTALLAFQLLRRAYERPVEYWLVGADYAPGGPAHRWAQAQGITAGVRFAGRLDHAALLAQLPTFDVLVHPAREESFGMTLVEAMQAGVPVVAGQQSGGVPWVLDEGRSGVLADVTSPAALAEAVLGLLRDPAGYAALSASGIRRAQEKFSVAAVTAAYETQYRHVLAASVSC